MCGISGYVINEGAPRNLVQILLTMNRAIRHRGPDDEGYVFVNRKTGLSAQFAGAESSDVIKSRIPQVTQAEAWIAENGCDLALGNRRFAIISPTPDGHQPFWDNCRKLVLSFNGEIYNYVEIRQELETLGRQFVTSTDTEVLAQAYAEWKDHCFERLNGMFAIAIYDFDRRELVLARDRTGERPLYWIRCPEGIYFASEIKALLETGRLTRKEVNDSVAHNFLRLAVADLDEKTFFTGIEKVPAATVVRISDDGRLKFHRYWKLPEGRPDQSNGVSVEAVCEQLRDLLRDSVRLRLRADVPINVALSGGMDSSSITAMAASLHGDGLETYTVRFSEREWNESKYAEAVADRYHVKKVVIDPPSEWIWGFFGDFAVAMEEPFHAPDLLPDYVIRRFLAAKGIKVNLAGIGGDELFAGYERYRDLRILELKHSGRRLRQFSEIARSSYTTPGAALWNLGLAKWRSFTSHNDRNDQESFWRSIITAPPAPLRSIPETLEARLAADVEWSLLPYWLRAGDKSSMSIPIEVRYPFLDHRLIEFAFRLPVDLLIRDGWLKWILRRAMEPLLPPEVVWRRNKMGFPFPILSWLRGSIEDLRVIVNEMDNPYLPRTFWQKNLLEIIEHDAWLTWRCLSFELWHRKFIRGLPVLPVELSDRKSVLNTHEMNVQSVVSRATESSHPL